MGYTNHWQQPNSFDDLAWQMLCTYATSIAPRPKGVVVEVHTTPDSYIYVQGGKYEDHEGFYLFKKKSKDDKFHFCKTNRKPYDATVWAILQLAELVGKGFTARHD